jgi:hypothetical protein
MRLRSLLSSVRLCGGQPAQARALAEDLSREPGLSREARAEAELTLMLAVSMSVESMPAQETERARRAAEALLAQAGREDQPTLAAALLVRAMHTWQAGQLAAALDIAREAARVASTATTLTCRGIAPLLLGGMLVSLGQLDQAGEVIRGLQAAAAATAPGGRDPSTEILAAGLALAAGLPAEAVTAPSTASRWPPRGKAGCSAPTASRSWPPRRCAAATSRPRSSTSASSRTG